MKTLKPGYYDCDFRMLHACFQLLVDFVEKERPFELIDWDHDERHRHAQAEIKELYHWWKVVYPARRSLLSQMHDDETPPTISFGDGGASDWRYPNYRNAIMLLGAQEEFWQKEETCMLVRLMKIRSFLWT